MIWRYLWGKSYAGDTGNPFVLFLLILLVVLLMAAMIVVLLGV
jgi:hypothetical protein